MNAADPPARSGPDATVGATALKALLMLVSSGVRSPGPAVTAQASRLTDQLVDEIEAHRALLAAERGELVPQLVDVPGCSAAFCPIC